MAKHDEVTRALVSQVHQLTRGLDDDPYADTLWGILTGFDAANALDIAETKAPLVIERVASGTEIALGLLFDRDAVAFYGDPVGTRGWRMADGDRAFEQKLADKDGTYTFSITPKWGEKNTNSSQRGWRPMVEHFPSHLKDIEVISGANLNPVIADDFILVPNPRDCDPEREYEIVFKAKPVG